MNNNNITLKTAKWNVINVFWENSYKMTLIPGGLFRQFNIPITESIAQTTMFGNVYYSLAEAGVNADED